MNTLGKIVLFDLLLWILVAIFMSPLLVQYSEGSGIAQTIASAYGISVTDQGAVTADVNTIYANNPTENVHVGSFISSALNFLAPLLVIFDAAKKLFAIALTPLALWSLPDTVLPFAFKLFVLLPMYVIAAIGIVGFVRGYFL